MSCRSVRPEFVNNAKKGGRDGQKAEEVRGRASAVVKVCAGCHVGIATMPQPRDHKSNEGNTSTNMVSFV